MSVEQSTAQPRRPIKHAQPVTSSVQRGVEGDCRRATMRCEVARRSGSISVDERDHPGTRGETSFVSDGPGVGWRPGRSLVPEAKQAIVRTAPHRRAGGVVQRHAVLLPTPQAGRFEPWTGGGRARGRASKAPIGGGELGSSTSSGGRPSMATMRSPARTPALAAATIAWSTARPLSGEPPAAASLTAGGRRLTARAARGCAPAASISSSGVEAPAVPPPAAPRRANPPGARRPSLCARSRAGWRGRGSPGGSCWHCCGRPPRSRRRRRGQAGSAAA